MLTNPNPDVEGVNSDRVALSKSKLISDPFMLSKYLSVFAVLLILLFYLHTWIALQAQTLIYLQ